MPELPRPDLRVVVLAAGASRRLGEPKALARIGARPEDTALALLLGAASALDDDPWIVTGKHHREIARHHKRLELHGRLLENPHWAQGRSGGLALAVSANPYSDVCIAPVDAPLVPAKVFVELAAAWRRAESPPEGWLAPQNGNRHGHPIILGRTLARALAALPSSTSLRVLREAARPIWAIPTDSERILDDLDTPEDLSRLRAIEGA